MKDYVIKYIEQTANYLNIDINEFYNILNEEWQSSYGNNLKRVAEEQGLNMIDYCYNKDKGDYSFLMRLIHLTDLREKKYFN